jgi:hypothetical protein
MAALAQIWRIDSRGARMTRLVVFRVSWSSGNRWLVYRNGD